MLLNRIKDQQINDDSLTLDASRVLKEPGFKEDHNLLTSLHIDHSLAGFLSPNIDTGKRSIDQRAVTEARRRTEMLTGYNRLQANQNRFIGQSESSVTTPKYNEQSSCTDDTSETRDLSRRNDGVSLRPKLNMALETIIDADEPGRKGSSQWDENRTANKNRSWFKDKKMSRKDYR